MPNVGCTNANACNYDAEANTDNGSCEYSSCLGCTDNGASNFDPEASIDNGQCTYDVFGCTLLIACNYDPAATVNDGSCDFTGCFGCVTPTACNYDDNALYPDGSCLFAAAGQDCDGNCLSDQDGDMVCDANEVPGCTDESALNYNPNATDDNGTCTYLMEVAQTRRRATLTTRRKWMTAHVTIATCAGCIVSGACNYDAGCHVERRPRVFPDMNGVCPSVCDFDVDGDGICDANEVAGCTYANAINFTPLATDDDGSCNFVGCVLPDYSSYNELANTNSGDCTNAPGSADFTGDGMVQLEDLLEFLVAYGTSGPEWGLDWVQDGCSVVAMGIAEMDVNFRAARTPRHPTTTLLPRSTRDLVCGSVVRMKRLTTSTTLQPWMTAAVHTTSAQTSMAMAKSKPRTSWTSSLHGVLFTNKNNQQASSLTFGTKERAANGWPFFWCWPIRDVKMGEGVLQFVP